MKIFVPLKLSRIDCAPIELADRLRTFWTAYGCTSLEASERKLGAATFHPEMIKLVMTSESCKLCYLQPTFRPFDSDYGLVLKLQRYLQYQVVIKPFLGGSAGKLYLRSVRALGLGRGLRIVMRKSGWESDSLCAWGEGWECRLNSVEVSQVTVFKQVCGVRCSVPVLEIAYGLERLSFAASGFRTEVSEAEMAFSRFNLEARDVANSLSAFKLFEVGLSLASAVGVSHRYYLIYDRLLEMIEIYNRVTAKRFLKRSVVRLLLTRLQRSVKRVAVALTTW
ncbi:MAG: glycine--tRNA ligase subunit alpha [Candidatus Hodgkinia cicadicola]